MRFVCLFVGEEKEQCYVVIIKQISTGVASVDNGRNENFVCLPKSKIQNPASSVTAKTERTDATLGREQREKEVILAFRHASWTNIMLSFYFPRRWDRIKMRIFIENTVFSARTPFGLPYPDNRWGRGSSKEPHVAGKKPERQKKSILPFAS